LSAFAIENLVVADGRCNGDERAFLAAPDHVGRWLGRNRQHASALADIAARASWDSRGERTLSVARAIDLRLPPTTKLWQQAGRFVDVDRKSLEALLVA